MGAWKSVFFRMRLIFIGNDSDQVGFADNKSERIKRHVSCQLCRATGPVREVLIEIV